MRSEELRFGAEVIVLYKYWQKNQVKLHFQANQRLRFDRHLTDLIEDNSPAAPARVFPSPAIFPSRLWRSSSELYIPAPVVV